MASDLFDVAATFDCLITINKWLPGCMTALWFWATTISIMACTALFHIDWILRWKIFRLEVYIPVEDQTLGELVATNKYGVDYTEFFGEYSEILEFVEMARSIIRDGVV